MIWALQDAKAQLSEVVRRAHAEGPQQVTVRGKQSIVVLSVEDYEALRRPKKKLIPLAELLRNSPVAGTRIDLRRAKDLGRKVTL